MRRGTAWRDAAGPDGGGPAGPARPCGCTCRGPAEHTDELSRTQSYGYDEIGRPTSYTAAPGIQWQFGYNKSHHQTSVTNPRGFATAYVVDGLGRVTQETQPDPDAGGPLAAPVSTFTYNDASELLTATDPRSYVTAYTYDGVGRLKTVTEPDPDGGGSQTNSVTPFHYDAVSNLTGVLDPRGNFADYFTTLGPADQKSSRQIPTGRGTSCVARPACLRLGRQPPR
jgi:YD repeat-containing protein